MRTTRSLDGGSFANTALRPDRLARPACRHRTCALDAVRHQSSYLAPPAVWRPAPNYNLLAADHFAGDRHLHWRGCVHPQPSTDANPPPADDQPWLCSDRTSTRFLDPTVLHDYSFVRLLPTIW